MMSAVEAAMEAAERGVSLDEKDMFEVFGDFDPGEYEEEARQRWGHTDAYQESMRRTAAYTKEDWLRIKAEGEAITLEVAVLFDEGASPEDDRVLALMERHWRSINDNFYSCPLEVFEGLGEMYVADARFAKVYDSVRPGMAVFMRDAMKAWVVAKRAG
jgi:hypothetical protein